MHLIIMPKKQSWPPVISKREQERREKFRQRAFKGPGQHNFASSEGRKREKKNMKFRKPHWPPVISSEERERRRFGERPSTSQQWPPVLKGVKVSGEIFKI